MKITGIKRWILLAVISAFSGTMVVTPYLRYNYYDQIVMLFTQCRQICDPLCVNEYIGDLALIFGCITTVMYILGGALVDKFGEKIMLVLGGVLMAGGSILFGLVLSSASMAVAFILFGFGTGTMWGGYLKLTRKLGGSGEQGRMYSTSEFVRGITGTVLGFAGVAILNHAVLPSGVTDPAVIGEKWRTLLFIHAGIYILCVILCLVLIPKNVMGHEESETDEGEAFTLKGAAEVLKLPGTWLTAAILLFGWSISTCTGGYLGAYTSNVIGISAAQASTFAIIRNYVISAISTLLIGYAAIKFKSESKTIGVYSFATAILLVCMLLCAENRTLCIAVTFVLAAAYTGMRGLYFAVASEVKIPVRLTGVATGIISFIGYLPDAYFAKLAGRWLDRYGLKGYDYIWFWAIACAVLGGIVCFITARYAKKLKGSTV
jgi:MFS family permease